MPTTRSEFWAKKFAANVSRDREHLRLLTEDGWDVAVVWECEVKHEQELADRLTRFLTSPAGTSSGVQGV
jgi:DNA mismatch endonuclease (patch repair protein)